MFPCRIEFTKGAKFMKLYNKFPSKKYDTLYLLCDLGDS